MRRIIVNVVLLAMCATTAQAATVTLERAQSIAQEFMTTTLQQPQAGKLEMVKSAARRAPGKNATATAPAYYVFNSTSTAVIVAGDDRMPAVLGYCDNGAFDPDNMAPGLEALLQSYEIAAEQIERDSDVLPQGSTYYTSIYPMLSSKWGQRAPFDAHCPYLEDKDQNAAVGCVATAMAQIMNYHKWPERPTAEIPAYVTKTRSIKMDALAPSQFPDWNQMKDYYSATEDGDAAAWLSRFCGQALEMDYNTSSGAATMDVPNALATYFDYAPSARYLNRESFNSSTWMQLIMNELFSNRPILYRGQTSAKGGHAFVLDGMDNDGRVHINWGWFGQSNGFFMLTNLNPSDQGAGSSVSNDGYIVSPAMVVGIAPSTRPADYNSDLRLTVGKMSLDQTTYTRSSSSSAFNSVKVGVRYVNRTGKDATFDYGLALYNEQGQVKGILATSTIELESGYARNASFTFNMPVAAGTYYIRPVCRESGNEAWNTCLGASVNSFKAVATETTLTLSIDGNYATPDFVVNSTSFSGIQETNRTIEFRANLTNNGTTRLTYLYLLVGGKYQTLAQCDIEPGESGDITMHLSSTTAGSIPVKLCYNEAGTQVLWQGNVTVSASPTHSLSFANVTATNFVSGTTNIADNVAKLQFNVTNNGLTAYNDYIVAKVFRRAGATSGLLFTTVSEKVSIGRGATSTINMETSKLVGGETYFIRLQYYKGGTLVNGGTLSWFTILDEQPQYDCDVNQDGTVDVTDVNIVINTMLGKASNLRADVNGDGTVDVTDVNLVINTMLGK